MREVIVYNANKELRNRLAIWLNEYGDSKDYVTSVLDFSSDRFFLRMETDKLINLFKRHWMGVLEFYELDTYNGRAVKIKVSKKKDNPKQDYDLLRQEISDWFKENIPVGDYRESLVQYGRIHFIKEEEDINLFRLVWGSKINIEVTDYMDYVHD